MAIKKDAYYFSHDANAQDDPKCMLLIDQMGMEGYGIFWALIEKLRSEKDYKLPFVIIPSLARRWGTSKEKVETVVNVYGLFELEDTGFFSARLVRSMREKSESARIAANKKWDLKRLHENADADLCGRIETHMPNDAIKVKESKVNETKENNISSTAAKPPAPKKAEIEIRKEKFTEEIKGYLETYPREMLLAFRKYWTEKNQSGKKMRFELEKTWETARRLSTWASREQVSPQTSVITTENHKTEYQKALERQKEKSQQD